MADQRSLVQRRGVRVSSRRVISIRIFSCVYKQSNNFNVSNLACHRQGQMSLRTVRCRQQSASILNAIQHRCNRQIDMRTARNQGCHRLKITMQSGRMDCAVRISSVVAKQIDQRNLNAALMGHAARRHQRQRHIARSLIRPGIKNHLRDFDNILRQLPMPNRILGNELQQRRAMKVIPTLEFDMLMNKLRMLFQMIAQSCRVSRIKQIHRSTKHGIFNSLMVRQLQAAREFRRLHMRLQPRPAFEAVLARDRELRIAQPQRAFKNLGIGSALETRIEFADALRDSAIVGGVPFEQIFGLIFEVVKVWVETEIALQA